MKNTKLLVSINTPGVDNFLGEVDLFKSSDLQPRITKQVFNIQDFDNARGDFTLNLKIPKTDNNIRIFNYLGNVQNEYNFYNLRDFRAQINVNGLTVIDGTLTITKVLPNFFEARIIGNNIAWSKLLGNKTLRDITSFRRIPFTYSRSFNFNPWPEQISGTIGLGDIWNDNSELYDIQFPLIAYGNYGVNPLAGTASNPITGIPLIESSGITANAIYKPKEYPFDQFEFRPAVYLKRALISLFKDYNYNVRGTFFSDPDIPDTLILPFVDSQNNEPNWNWRLLAQFKTDVIPNSGGCILDQAFNYFVLDTNEQGQPIGYGPFVFYNMTVKLRDNEILYDYANSYYPCNDISARVNTAEDIYVIRKTGNYRIRFTGTITHLGQTNTRSVAFVAADNSSEDKGLKFLFRCSPASGVSIVNSDRILLSFLNTPIQTNGQTQTQNFDIEGIFNLTQGTILRFGASMNRNGFNTYGSSCTPGDQLTLNLINTQAEVECVDDNYDYLLNPAVCTPDIRQIDFVKNIINTFNLYLTVDYDSKIISFDTYNSYFNNTTQFDWTEKTDLKLAEISPANSYKQIKLLTADQEGEVFIVKDKESDYVFLSDSLYYKNEYDIQIGFADTIYRDFNYISNFTAISGTSTVTYELSTLVNIPMLNTRDDLVNTLGQIGEGAAQTIYNYTPRILDYSGLTTITSVSNEVIDIYIGKPNTAYNVITYNQFPLCDTNVRYVNFNQFLYNRFWERKLIDIDKSFIVKVEAYLTEADIANINFRQPIKIGNQVFRIQRIENFNPSEDTLTTVYLYKI